MEGTLKMKGFVLKAALLLVVLLGLVLRTEAQGLSNYGASCVGVGVGVGLCTDLLEINSGIDTPSHDCCLGLRNRSRIAVKLGDNTTCQCIKNSRPLLGLPGPILSLEAQILLLTSVICRGILGLNNATSLPLQCLVQVQY